MAALQQGDSASIALTEQLVATRAELSRATAQVSALERAGFELQSLLDRARASAAVSDAEHSAKVQAPLCKSIVCMQAYVFMLCCHRLPKQMS